MPPVSVSHSCPGSSRTSLRRPLRANGQEAVGVGVVVDATAAAPARARRGRRAAAVRGDGDVRQILQVGAEHRAAAAEPAHDAVETTVSRAAGGRLGDAVDLVPRLHDPHPRPALAEGLEGAAVARDRHRPEPRAPSRLGHLIPTGGLKATTTSWPARRAAPSQSAAAGAAWAARATSYAAMWRTRSTPSRWKVGSPNSGALVADAEPPGGGRRRQTAMSATDGGEARGQREQHDAARRSRASAMDLHGWSPFGFAGRRHRARPGRRSPDATGAPAGGNAGSANAPITRADRARARRPPAAAAWRGSAPMHPDWLGSPQHFVGGAFAAAVAISRRRPPRRPRPAPAGRPRHRRRDDGERSSSSWPSTPSESPTRPPTTTRSPTSRQRSPARSWRPSRRRTPSARAR